jgi:prepilin-type N-terminal cleavage/methylation domain-containing protein
MTRAPHSAGIRRGFTLLEVLLASAIALLLMAGLYVAMEVQLRQAQEARAVVDEATVVRSVVSRISSDLTPCLTPAGGRMQSNSTSGGGAASAATGTGQGGSSSSSSSSSGSGGAGASGSGGSTDTQSQDSVPSNFLFQAGVVGDNKRLTIYVSRVPGAAPPSSDMSADAPTPSDLWMVVYGIAENGGLTRQETPWLTSDDALNLVDLDSSDLPKYVIEEVVDIDFEYWDGSAWQSSWDGTQLSDDQKTPIGPPMAIAVTLTVRMPSSGRSDQPAEKKCRHVIAIPTAPAPPTSADTTTTTTPMP